MPLYEYYCSDCKSRFELLLFSHNHADDIVCTKCRSENVRRLLSLFASRGGNSMEDMSFDDAPSMGSCGCSDGGCGCH